MSRTLVIAESGSTANGDLDVMRRQIKFAAAIGCDIHKTQWVSSPERLCERRHAPEYLDAYRKIAWPQEWHPILAAECKQAGLQYMSTTYLPEDVAVVAPYVWAFKISAFEAGDSDFLVAHRPYTQLIYVSTGMMDERAENGIFAALDAVGSRVHLLHCVSAYPAPPEDMNLALLQEVGVYQGLSDHTRHPWTGALAVAAGARVIEFHYRLADCDPANADYEVARSPDEAREYVRNIRIAETMLGDGRKRPMPCEAPMMRYRVKR